MVSIVGKVVNYWTGKPVSGITVMLDSRITTTNENGEYKLDNLSPNIYNITLIHKDYERTVVSADLRVEQAYSVDPIKIKPIFKVL